VATLYERMREMPAKPDPLAAALVAAAASAAKLAAAVANGGKAKPRPQSDRP